jgi:hypothetical protein
MDEPESLGGTDKGMNPVEGLLISLGSCLVIVVSAFAKAHKINVQDVGLRPRATWNPMVSCSVKRRPPRLPGCPPDPSHQIRFSRR